MYIEKMEEIKENIEEPKQKSKKSQYMSNYMRKRYIDNPALHRNKKNSLNMKKKYFIKDETATKYNEYLYHIVQLKLLIDELPEGMFETFLMEYKNLQFVKKEVEL